MSAADHDTRKRFSTLQARAALMQVALVQTTNDREQPLFVVSRWALTKSFSSLDEVEAWLTERDHAEEAQ